MSEEKNHNKIKLNESGFTIIESLVAIAIFSVMFMALTSAIWSSTTNFRTTSYADESMKNGQDAVEMLSVINILNVTSPTAGWTTLPPRGDQRIRYRVVDISGNFRTIAMEVYHSTDAVLSPSELRTKTYYRRMIYK